MAIRRQFAHGLIIGASLVLVACWVLCGAERGQPAVASSPSSTAARTQPPPGSPAPPPQRDFRAEAVFGEAAYLCWGIGPRPTGSAAERRAATYLAKRLAELGYRVTVQGPVPLPGLKRTTTNVIGLARCPVSGPRVLVGAHYDTVSALVPGANDNASGVAVVLEVARVLAGRPLPYVLEFVLFGGEERRPAGGSRAGSRHFVARDDGPATAMINVDMVGCGDELHAWGVGGHTRYLSSLLARSAAAMGLPLDTGHDDPDSDHAPFGWAGIPAVWLQSLPDPRNHTPRDQPQALSAVSLQRAGRLLVHTLTAIETEDLRLLRDCCRTEAQVARRSGR
jgi:hypothetical protein